MGRIILLDITGCRIVANLFRHYGKEESGATAIEYGIFGMIALIAVISFLGTGGVADSTFQKLTAVSRALDGPASAGHTQAQGQLRTQTGLVDQTHMTPGQIAKAKRMAR